MLAIQARYSFIFLLGLNQQSGFNFHHFENGSIEVRYTSGGRFNEKLQCVAANDVGELVKEIRVSVFGMVCASSCFKLSAKGSLYKNLANQSVYRVNCIAIFLIQQRLGSDIQCKVFECMRDGVTNDVSVVFCVSLYTNYKRYGFKISIFNIRY